MDTSAVNNHTVHALLLAAAGSSVAKVAAGKARAAADEGAAAATAGVASQQLQGGLQVLLQLPLTVAGRDYLRSGEHCAVCRCLWRNLGGSTAIVTCIYGNCTAGCGPSLFMYTS
jgi:hypothetical protein